MAAVCVQNVMKLATVSQKLYRQEGHTVQTLEDRKLINATEQQDDWIDRCTQRFRHLSCNDYVHLPEYAYSTITPNPNST
jgi:hypothetical protein